MHRDDTGSGKPAGRGGASGGRTPACPEPDGPEPVLTRREEAARRVLNLLFSLSIAVEPLTTDQIISDPEIGYASPGRDSRIKAFNRDRETLSAHGIFIREVTHGGATKNEQRAWKIDRALSFADRRSIRAQDAEDAVGAIDRMFALHADDPARWPLQVARTKLCEVAGLDPGATGEVGETKRDLTFVWSAFSRRKPARISYRDARGRETSRVLDVYGMFEQGSCVYLVGFDHDARGIRTFRTDRVTAAKPAPDSAKTYVIPPEFEVAGFHFLPFDFGEGEPVEARFSLPEGLGRNEAELITKRRGVLERVPGDGWLWTVDIRDIDAAARFALERASLGLRALEPVSLVESISLRKNRAVMAHAAH